MSTLDPPPLDPARARRRIVFFTGIALALLLAVWVFGSVMGPFLVAFLLAYVLAPLVRLIERIRLGPRRIPRWAAVIVLYLSFFASMIGLVLAGSPLVLAELQRLSQELPAALRVVSESWLPAIDETARMASSPFRAAVAQPEAEGNGPREVSEIRITPHSDGSYGITLPPEGVEIGRTPGDRVVVAANADTGADRSASDYFRALVRRELAGGKASLNDALRTVRSVVASVVTSVFTFFITVFLSAYILATSDEILAFFRRLVRADARGQWDRLLVRVDRGLTGVVRGQIVICLVNAVLSGIGFYLIGLKYWVLLALTAGAFSIIPIFGSIISSIPVVLVALPQGLGMTALVLAWIVGIHQLEAHVLNPKILGDAARLHPVLVVFALIAGEHVYGLLGAILAVPALSIAQSLFLHFEALALQNQETGTSLKP